MAGNITQAKIGITEQQLLYSITTEDRRVRPKHVLIEFKKWMCYIDGQKNKYSVLKDLLQQHTYIYGEIVQELHEDIITSPSQTLKYYYTDPSYLQHLANRFNLFFFLQHLVQLCPSYSVIN
jgi:hypothetical protein